MSRSTDIRCVGAKLYFLPVHTRVPLKFGAETVTYVTCARVCLTVEDRQGRRAVGWGETPLSVQWVWPSKLPYDERHTALQQFCIALAQNWTAYEEFGHPMELGYEFQETILPSLAKKMSEGRGQNEPMPRLAALVCCSLFDIALHDAYGALHNLPIYQTYNAEFMNRDLADFLVPASGNSIDFKNKFPVDFLSKTPSLKLPAWHLVGGLDPLDESELTGSEPNDGFPVTLLEWIQTDGLKCLKIKLRGNDSEWDYNRLLNIGKIAMAKEVEALSADFNCTVTDPNYVNEILDRLQKNEPHIFSLLLYVEQPFPYDLEANRIDVHSVSARSPLFLDESAHDWRVVKLGRELGWTGVALKTCKTQTGALLSACWAKAHGMPLMVQDLTNPMLAQIPHVLLAANVGTIMGVETNSMQFYPEASMIESKVHPGIYQRKNGEISLATIRGNGFGYRLEKMNRELPQVAAEFGV
ncbi:MAG: mandelate racemase/muconate lactonizing enzyme family protein [Verrucomicrobia bacterium]|nr:mandelate racemase/muconate lactonizing enzyme family protein [Verrucomicrobiota bacterium]